VTPTTRTVLDTALMLDAMSGPVATDPNTSSRPATQLADTVRQARDLRGLRIGWRLLLGNSVVAADVALAVKAAVAQLAEAGASVAPAEHVFDNAEPIWSQYMLAYRHAQYGHLLAQHRDIMCPTFVRQIERGMEISAADLFACILMRTQLFRSVQSWFENFDVIAMPTLSRTALPIDHDHFAPISIDGQVVGTCRKSWYPYTLPFNLTGHPAITLPCGFGNDDLPIGLQLVGRPGEDGRLLQVAAVFEQLRPWAAVQPTDFRE